MKKTFTVSQAYQSDQSNSNYLWCDAIEKEMASLKKMECFKYKEPGFIPFTDFQKTKLRFHFTIKQDGRHKSCLVVGGHLVAFMDGIRSHSTIVKGTSVQLLDLIAHRDKLISLCDDIGNAFITSPCLEKVYTVTGPEFDEQQDSVVIIEKA